MLKSLAGVSLVFCHVLVAADSAPTESVDVISYGKIRHGVVAIGGETTGTTLTLNDIIFELQLSSDADQKFASDHNKELVAVHGSLRKISAVESKTRWIIDVKKLLPPEKDVLEQGMLLEVVGRLATPGDKCGEGVTMAIVAGEQTWPIEFGDNSKLKATAEISLGQIVQIRGQLTPLSEENSCAPGAIRVTALDRSPNEPSVE